MSTQIRITVSSVCLLLLVACAWPNPATSDEPATRIETAPNPRAELAAPWGAGCNNALLAGPFTLEHGTDFKVPAQNLQRMNEVFEELRRGYGGTLVTAPRDDILDSSAFLAHYLRAFSSPENLSEYDYRFERMLARLSTAETVLDDPRLDWDIWRAYLLYENLVAVGSDANEYKKVEGGETYIHGLDSAKDLLWTYLTYNFTRIQENKQRLHWWIESLTQGMDATGGRPLRRWFLLQLVSSSDTKTAALIPPANSNEKGSMFPMLKPDPFHPFIILEGAVTFSDEQQPQPPFKEAIDIIARSQKLSYVLLGIDPATMPATKAVDTDLAPRLSQFAPAKVLSQESWSEKPQSFSVHFSRPIGRRSAHYNVQFPFSDSQDGVFFFTYDARLYVWPKAQMDNGVIQLLHISRLIEDRTYEKFLSAGYKRLNATTPGE